MGAIEKMLAGITKVIRMDGKVEGLAQHVDMQQQRIEDLTARVIRLETALEIAMAGKALPSPD
mgnify:FL=1